MGEVEDDFTELCEVIQEETGKISNVINFDEFREKTEDMINDENYRRMVTDVLSVCEDYYNCGVTNQQLLSNAISMVTFFTAVVVDETLSIKKDNGEEVEKEKIKDVIIQTIKVLLDERYVIQFS